MRKIATALGVLAMAFAGATAAPVHYAVGEVNLIGNVYQSNDPTLNGAMVRLPMRDGAPLEVIGRCPSDVIDASWGGFMRNGKYYATFQWAITPTMAYSTVRVYDPSTWTVEASKICADNVHNVLASAIAYNESEDKVYGAYLSTEGSSSKYVFGTCDYDAANPAHSPIADIKGNPWSALAFDNDGTLYVITSKGEFGTVNKTTGEVTLKGSTGITSTALSSAIIDKKTGRFLWTVNNASASGLYEIDKTTGTASLVASFPNAGNFIGGLYVDTPLAADAAPERVTGLETAFTNGSLSGTVSFTMPSTLFDGTNASGEADWTVLANGELVKTGKAAYGAKVDAAVTVARADDWTFEVYASNDAGNSPRCSTTLFVGNATPLAPENLTLVYADGKMNLTWNAVDKCLNDKGYFNASDVTYTVTRFPDGTIVSSGKKLTSLSDPIAEPEVRTVYYYTVKAVYRDNESAASESPAVVLGALSAPWCTDFSGFDLGDMSTYDANNDGVCWSQMSDAACLYTYTNFNGVPMDDWLFTPALKLIGGETYIFEVDEYFMPIFGSQAQNKFEIKMGSAATPEGMTETLLAMGDASNTSKGEHSFIIRPEETKTVFFAVHVKCDLGNFFYVPRMQLSIGHIPAAVSDMVCVPDPNGVCSATISFKAPDKDIAGRPITELTKIEVFRAETNLIYSVDNPEPGKTYSFVDDKGFAGSGNYRWTFHVYSEYGEGPTSDLVDYVGVPVLCQQNPVEAFENGDTGEVTLNWTTIFKDNNGRDVNPDLVTFNIYNRSELVATGLPSSTNTYTIQATEPGEQKFFLGMVNFVTQPGSTTAVSPIFAVGTPFTSYSESFLMESEHELVSSDSRYYAQWAPLDDGLTEISSSDGDGRCYYLSCEYVGGGSDLLFGKFDFRNMDHPTMVIDVLRTDASDTNTLSFLVDDGSGYKVAKTITIKDLNAADYEWTTVSADLSEYAGKIVHLKIDGALNYYGTMFIDRVRVLNQLQHNVTAGKLQGPDSAYPGIPVRLTAEVFNYGAEEAKDVTVNLLLDGEITASESVASIPTNGTAIVTFEQTVTVLSPETLVYSFEVAFADDEDTSDNIGSTLTLPVVLPTYPAVDDLSASSPDGSYVELTWSEPAETAAGLSLMGFNVYRDNAKVNSEPVEDTRFVDYAPNGQHTYAVTAVYSQGESRGSNVVTANVTSSGVSGIFADGVEVSVAGHKVTVAGAAGKTLALYSIIGTKIFKGVADATTVIEAPAAGVYVVVVGAEASKIVVR